MPVKVKYVGPLDEVQIAAAPELTVRRNGHVEVHRDIADELVRSGDFKRVVSKSRPKATPDEQPGDDDAEATSQEGDQPEGVEG